MSLRSIYSIVSITQKLTKNYSQYSLNVHGNFKTIYIHLYIMAYIIPSQFIKLHIIVITLTILTFYKWKLKAVWNHKIKRTFAKCRYVLKGSRASGYFHTNANSNFAKPEICLCTCPHVLVQWSWGWTVIVKEELFPAHRDTGLMEIQLSIGRVHTHHHMSERRFVTFMYSSHTQLDKEAYRNLYFLYIILIENVETKVVWGSKFMV